MNYLDKNVVSPLNGAIQETESIMTDIVSMSFDLDLLINSLEKNSYTGMQLKKFKARFDNLYRRLDVVAGAAKSAMRDLNCAADSANAAVYDLNKLFGETE